MDLRLGFCWNEVLSASEGGILTILGDPRSGLSIFEGLTIRNEIRTPKISIFGASILSSLETQLYKCAKLTNFSGRWVSG